MEGERKEISISLTKKSKKPCLWEGGGGCSNTGACQLIADAKGEPKAPLFIRSKGHLANSSHALLPLEVGDLVLEVWRSREEFEVEVVKVIDINLKEKKATVEVVFQDVYDRQTANWLEGKDPDEYLQPLIRAGIEKALCYHCREPHYIKEVEIR